MLQVARIVESDAHAQRVARSPGLELDENFAHVFALCRELRGARGILRIVAEEVAVLFHARTAPSRICDDDVYIRALRRLNRPPSQREGSFIFTRVDQQAHAARLLLRRDDFASRGGKHARRGRIYLRKKFALYASQQQANPQTLPTLGGSHLGDSIARRQVWEKRFHGLYLFRQKLQRARGAQQRLQPRLLVCEERPAHPSQAIRAGEYGQNKLPMQLLANPPPLLPPHLAPP